MDFTLESKACAACAKAKRRCGKQIPSCSRCTSRGVRCEYAPGPNAFTLPPQQPDNGHSPHTLTGSAGQVASAQLADAADTDPSFGLFNNGGNFTLDGLLAMDFDYTFTSAPNPSSLLKLNSKDLTAPWYLQSDSWDIKHQPETERTTPYCTDVFTKYIGQIQGWLKTWIDTGTNPYIHKHLFTHHMPECIQDAYTLLSTYLTTTPEQKSTVFRLLEERLKQLLRDQPDRQLPTEDDITTTPGSATGSSPTTQPTPRALNIFEHLTRVQALHIYQTIGLFDGNIRARHVAETQIPTLNTWIRAMLDCARATTTAATAAGGGHDACIAAFARTLLPPSDSNSDGSTTGFIGGGDAAEAWAAWVVSECVRRVYLVAGVTQTVYLAMQLKWAPCAGAVKFHTPGGLWGAGSAWAWKRAWDRAGPAGAGSQEEMDLVFVERAGWERVFEGRRPEEVDEFTRNVLEVSFGSEMVEEWENGAL